MKLETIVRMIVPAVFAVNTAYATETKVVTTEAKVATTEENDSIIPQNNLSPFYIY